jgi:hypothetical protein
VRLQQILRTSPATEAAMEITGLGAAHPLFDDVVAVLERHRS